MVVLNLAHHPHADPKGADEVLRRDNEVVVLPSHSAARTLKGETATEFSTVKTVTCADVVAAACNPVRAAAYSVVAIRLLRDLDAGFTNAGEPSLNPLTQEQADEMTCLVHEYAAANPHRPMEEALRHAHLKTRVDVLGPPTVN